MRSTLPAVLAATVLLVGCAADESPPTAPDQSPLTATVSRETSRLEDVARRFARALQDPDFRARLYQRLQSSPYPEGKIQLQRTLRAEGHAELRAMASLNGEPEATLDATIGGTQALEVYLPVPAHRAAWRGDDRLLVATQGRDGDVPVAFDLRGGRHILDPARPPLTPVLAVVPVETDFDAPTLSTQMTTICDPSGECGGGGGGGGGNSLVSPPGLYMTRAHFVQDFEGWLKGSPEFEIHIMGQNGTTDSLRKYQCAGEEQPAPYNWDGGTDWAGSVMLFSAAELSAYKTGHPGETFRVVAMEDDDTHCVMKVDQNRWLAVVAALGTAYRDITGATDTGTTKKYVAAGRSLRKLLAAIASWLKSNDDLIGNAIEDKVVGEYHTGFNWILRGDGNATNGWIKLEMK
jgi:hypothetical protein